MIGKLVRAGWGSIGFGRLQTLSLATFSHGFVAIAFFLQMALLARLLPVGEFGHLATLLAISAVVEAAVGARGTETALAALAEVPADDIAARQALTQRLFRIDLGWSSAIYATIALAVVGYDMVTGSRSGWLLILLAGSFAAFPWGTTKSYLTLFKGPRAFAPIEITYAAVSLLAGLGLCALFGGIGFVAGLAFASVVRTVLGLRQAGLSLRIARTGATQSDPPQQNLAWFGVTGIIRAGLLSIGGQMDILLLSAASSSAAVGLYRAAKTLSGLVQRLTQPLWFVLKRHIIVGSRGEASRHSRRVVLAASLGFAAIGAVIVPVILFFGGDIVATAFGERYRGAAEALTWLVPGAWIYYGVTGWSGLFGSVANERLTVIAIYLVQMALFAVAALVGGITLTSLAFALALSQVFVAAGFWLLFLKRSPARDLAAGASREK